MVLRLGLLLMDELPGRARAVRGDYADLFARLFRRHPVDLVPVAIHRGDAPASLADCDGWIAGGSRYSVYDDLGWIDTAGDIVRAAVAEERPFVGVCFGHQLLARALGGRVERAEVGWGLGAQPYDTVQAVPWLADATIALLASHRDQVTEPPPGGRTWSRAAYCPVAGLLVGERAWSMQGHPEFTAGVVRVLYEGFRGVAGDDVVDAALASLERPLSNDVVAEAIVRFVRGAARPAAGAPRIGPHDVGGHQPSA